MAFPMDALGVLDSHGSGDAAFVWITRGGIEVT